MPQRHISGQLGVRRQPACRLDRLRHGRPGPRIRDVSYGAFLWLNLGWDGQSPQDQVRRLRLWCDEYRLVSRENLVEEIKQRMRETVKRRAGDGDSDAARWWQHQLGWLQRHERSIAP